MSAQYCAGCSWLKLCITFIPLWFLQRFFIQCGTYLILEKLTVLAYRNLFKQVWVSLILSSLKLWILVTLQYVKCVCPLKWNVHVHLISRSVHHELTTAIFICSIEAHFMIIPYCIWQSVYDKRSVHLDWEGACVWCFLNLVLIQIFSYLFISVIRKYLHLCDW